MTKEELETRIAELEKRVAHLERELKKRVAYIERVVKEATDWIAINEPSKLPASVESWSY